MTTFTPYPKETILKPASLDFYIKKSGFIETNRKEVSQGKFTLIFLATAHSEPEIELTYN